MCMSQREPECNGNTCEDDGQPEPTSCSECGAEHGEQPHAFNCSHCTDCEPSDYAFDSVKEVA